MNAAAQPNCFILSPFVGQFIQFGVIFQSNSIQNSASNLCTLVDVFVPIALNDWKKVDRGYL